MTKLQLKNLIKEVIAEASTRKVWVVVGMEDEGVVSAVFSSEEKAMAYTSGAAQYIQEVDLDPIN